MLGIGDGVEENSLTLDASLIMLVSVGKNFYWLLFRM